MAETSEHNVLLCGGSEKCETNALAFAEKKFIRAIYFNDGNGFGLHTHTAMPLCRGRSAS